MDTRIFLTKIILLLAYTKANDVSGYEGLMTNALSKMKDKKGDEKLIGAGKTVKLIDFLAQEIVSKDIFDEDNYKASIELMTDFDPGLFKTVSKQLDREISEDKVKRKIATLSRDVTKAIKEQEFKDIIANIDYRMKFDRRNIDDFHAFASESIAKLEPYGVPDDGMNDPAIITSVNFSKKEEVEESYKSVIRLNEEGGRYVTGFQGINDFTFGGFKPGEAVSITALKHNYKSGLSLAIFLSIVQLNAPIMRKKDVEKGLKPLALRISFEDEVSDNTEYAFKYYKGASGEMFLHEDLNKFSPEEMSDYVTNRINVNGWETMMLKVNPNDWSYAHLSNFILTLEAQGYALCMLGLDYATLLPTIGCKQGHAGADLRDLFKKIKHLCAGRGALFLTPLQMNSAAQLKLDMGTTPARLLREVCNSSPYDSCKGLGQEIDVELFIHIVYHNGSHWANIVRGKRKGNQQVPREEMKCIFYKFPCPNTPLIPDYNTDAQFVYHLPRATANGMEGMSMGEDIMQELAMG